MGDLPGTVDLHAFLGPRPAAGQMLFSRVENGESSKSLLEVRHLPGGREWELTDPFEPYGPRFYHLRADDDGMRLLMVQHGVDRRDYMQPPLLYLPRHLRRGETVTSRSAVVDQSGARLGDEILRVRLLAREALDHPHLGHLDDTLHILLEYDNGDAGLDTFYYRAAPGLFPLSGHRLEDTPSGRRDVRIDLVAARLGNLRAGSPRALQRLSADPSPPRLATPVDLHNPEQLRSLALPLRVGGADIAGCLLEEIRPGNPAVYSFRRGPGVFEWVLTSYPDEDVGYLRAIGLGPVYLCLRPGLPPELRTVALKVGEVLRRVLLRSLSAQ